jgi:hypothetical protein
MALEAWAQNHHRYNPSAETVVKGTIESIAVPDAPRELVRITVKSGDNEIVAELAPQKYLKEVGCELAAGDKVVLTGVKIKEGDKDLFLVRTLERGNDMFTFRGPEGQQAW